MFLNSFFSGIKKGSSILGLSTTVTSATVGSVTSYYLFKGDENNEELDKLKSDLEDVKENLRAEMVKIKGDKFAKRFEVMKQKFTVERKNKCFKDEMQRHNDELTDWKIGYVPDLEKCRKIKVD